MSLMRFIMGLLFCGYTLAFPKSLENYEENLTEALNNHAIPHEVAKSIWNALRTYHSTEKRGW